MPFESGKPKTGGRTKGTPNKVTSEVQKIFQTLTKEEVPYLKEALARVREEDPRSYYQLWLNTAEFVAPKLARSELQAEITDPFDRKLIEQFTDEELIEFARSRAAKRS